MANGMLASFRLIGFRELSQSYEGINFMYAGRVRSVGSRSGSTDTNEL
jgi:hypothetical protein